MLSRRLEAIKKFIEGRVLADIGTDHALLPISACLDGIVERAIACDVSPGPLARARANIQKHGLEDRIEARLGFGMRPLKPSEADCVVISGMGGINIVTILKNSPRLNIRRLIVQPQRDTVAVRRCLESMDFRPIDDFAVREGERFYDIIVVGGES